MYQKSIGNLYCKPSSEQFKHKPSMQCHMNRKNRKDKIITQNIAKQAHANTADPATHLNDAQPMGKYAENVARGPIFKQYAEARQTKQAMT